MNTTSKKLATAALAAAVSSGIGMLTIPATANAASGDSVKVTMVKCYGIAKKGMNDCGGKGTGHSCQGQAKIDSNQNDWLLIPKGTCNKIVGGSTMPAYKLKGK